MAPTIRIPCRPQNQGESQNRTAPRAPLSGGPKSSVKTTLATEKGGVNRVGASTPKCLEALRTRHPGISVFMLQHLYPELSVPDTGFPYQRLKIVCKSTPKHEEVGRVMESREDRRRMKTIRRLERRLERLQRDSEVFDPDLSEGIPFGTMPNYKSKDIEPKPLRPFRYVGDLARNGGDYRISSDMGHPVDNPENMLDTVIDVVEPAETVELEMPKALVHHLLQVAVNYKSAPLFVNRSETTAVENDHDYSNNAELHVTDETGQPSPHKSLYLAISPGTESPAPGSIALIGDIGKKMTKLNKIAGDVEDQDRRSLYSPSLNGLHQVHNYGDIAFATGRDKCDTGTDIFDGSPNLGLGIGWCKSDYTGSSNKKSEAAATTSTTLSIKAIPTENQSLNSTAATASGKPVGNWIEALNGVGEAKLKGRGIPFDMDIRNPKLLLLKNGTILDLVKSREISRSKLKG